MYLYCCCLINPLLFIYPTAEVAALQAETRKQMALTYIDVNSSTSSFRSRTRATGAL
jgi:hypothetical protein